jgi:divalent metal cation (Fe/Co/Zn/Cd) transporter
VVIGFELAKTSLEKIFAPTPVAFSVPAAAVLAVSIGVKLWLSFFNTRLGRKINSSALLATAADSRNDVISTAAVLVASVVEAWTSWQIDAFLGLAVSVFILYSGITLGKETISPLLGEAASPELRELIINTIRSNPKVLGYHDLMVHDYGPGQRFASIHVEMDQREDPLYCHELIDDMERQCLNEHNVHLVIHYDPVVTDDPVLAGLRERVSGYLQQFDPRLTMHDFRMVQSAGHTNLIFDINTPAELMPRKKAIKQHLDTCLNRDGSTTYYTVITFDPAAFNQE